MTLTGRVTAVVTVTVLLCIAGVTAVTYALEARDLRNEIDQDLTALASTMANRLLESGEVDDVVRGGPLGVSTTYAQMVRRSGEVVPLSTSEPVLPVDDRALLVARGEGDRFFEDVEIDGSHIRVLTVPVRSGGLQVATPVDEIDLHLIRVAGVLVFIGFVSLAVALASGRLVARASLKPVRRLAVEAEAMATTHDLGKRLVVSGQDELTRLARSLNTLIDALEMSVARQRQLVADASHELKTPLTGLRTEIEILDGQEAVSDLSEARSALDDLMVAIDDLVELARVEQQTAVVDTVALDEVVGECVAWMRRHREDVPMEVDLHPWTVEGVRSQIARAVHNVVDNAVKHSPRGKAVEIRLTDGVLKVRDHGSGIDDTDLPFVFDRFYRATTSRGLPGTGLGLAIVRKVTDAHGWRVSLDNAPGGGVMLTLDTRSANSAELLSHNSSNADTGGLGRGDHHPVG